MLIAAFNNSGISLIRGQVVKQTGTSQARHLPMIGLASALTEDTVFGVLANDSNNNSTASVIISGSLKPFDTSSYSLNDPVYLSDSGTLSPSPGTTTIIVGKAITIGVTGCIFIGSYYASSGCC